jgi:uncharacterized membrane protein YbhN (UPF0104 family)
LGNALATVQRLQRYRHAWSRLALALLLTVVLQALVAVCYALLGQAVGSALPPVTFFVVIPILFIIVSLPISVGGLGVREGALVALLGAAGGNASEAAAIGLLYLAVLLALTLPGGLVLLVRRDSQERS